MSSIRHEETSVYIVYEDVVYEEASTWSRTILRRLIARNIQALSGTRPKAIGTVWTAKTIWESLLNILDSA